MAAQPESCLKKQKAQTNKLAGLGQHFLAFVLPIDLPQGMRADNALYPFSQGSGRAFRASLAPVLGKRSGLVGSPEAFHSGTTFNRTPKKAGEDKGSVAAGNLPGRIPARANPCVRGRGGRPPNAYIPAQISFARVQLRSSYRTLSSEVKPMWRFLI